MKKQRNGHPLTIYLHDDLITSLKALAYRERRSVSNMLAVILRDGLSKKTQQKPSGFPAGTQQQPSNNPAETHNEPDL